MPLAARNPALSVRSVPTDDVRARLGEVRRIVHEMVPDAGVTSSDAMPTSTLAGRPLLADRRRAGG
jgi:hypothetical protein